MSRRYSLALLAMLSAAGSACSQTPPPFRFSTKLDLVVLHATVRDKKGWFAADLQQPDFAVFEDRVSQSIRLFRHEDIPVAVGLVVDHSGSMAPKLKEVIAAARTFVASSRADDDMFVVNFNEKVTVESSADLAKAIASRPTLGKTALYDALIKSLEQIQTSSREKKVLLIISDGGDNASSRSLSELLRALEQSNVLVYAVGIFDENDPDGHPAVLRRLAHITGGEAFFPQQLTQVVSICEHVARDIRNQYTVGYVSNSVEKPGAYRTVRMVVHARGRGELVVRTRSGYIASEIAK